MRLRKDIERFHEVMVLFIIIIIIIIVAQYWKLPFMKLRFKSYNVK